MTELKQRAKTLVELAENAAFYARSGSLPLSEKAKETLTAEARGRLARLKPRLEAVEAWAPEPLERAVRAVAQPLRAALTGATVSPGIFGVMAVLGREETLARLSGIVI